MSLTPRLDLRQSQTLAMTPRLQQAIRLLQMSALELESAVAEELEKILFWNAKGRRIRITCRKTGNFPNLKDGKTRPLCWIPPVRKKRRRIQTIFRPKTVFTNRRRKKTKCRTIRLIFLWIPGPAPERPEKTTVLSARLICAPRRGRLCMTL